MKWQVDKMASWWNSNSLKMTSYQNGMLTKWQIDEKVNEMATHQNDRLTNDNSGQMQVGQMAK